MVNGNEAQLMGLLMNLIDNALRYTPEGGKVTVGLEQKRSQIIITVTDNGPGIPAEVRERVFERFYRNAAPDQPGSGLGLAIVREIVQASQGAIRLDAPAQGSGLVATVSLPALAG